MGHSTSVTNNNNRKDSNALYSIGLNTVNPGGEINSSEINSSDAFWYDSHSTGLSKIDYRYSILGPNTSPNRFFLFVGPKFQNPVAVPNNVKEWSAVRTV